MVGIRPVVRSGRGGGGGGEGGDSKIFERVAFVTMKGKALHMAAERGHPR